MNKLIEKNIKQKQVFREMLLNQSIRAALIHEVSLIIETIVQQLKKSV